MIIIRTNHDPATYYLYCWTESLIQEAINKGFSIVKLEEGKISESSVRSIIRKKRPHFIFFNGHGTSSSLFDNKKNEFITLESADIFKNTVAFARACQSLKELGIESVRKGCQAFIGYKKQFWIPRHHKRECQPLKDIIASPIFECSNAIVSSLLKGKTVKQAIEKSHTLAVECIVELIYSKEPLAPATLQALVANDEALGYEGNDTATIVS